MNITMQRRAEIAFDLLDAMEQKKLQRALDKLDNFSAYDFFHSNNIHKLHSFSGENLYSLKGSQNLRILLSVDKENNEKCIVEDIFTVEKLKNLPVFKNQHVV